MIKNDEIDENVISHIFLLIPFEEIQIQDKSNLISTFDEVRSL